MYYENGNLKSIGNYINGNAEGNFKYYKENGELNWECIMKMET